MVDCPGLKTHWIIFDGVSYVRFQALIQKMKDRISQAALIILIALHFVSILAACIYRPPYIETNGGILASWGLSVLLDIYGRIFISIELLVLLLSFHQKSLDFASVQHSFESFHLFHYLIYRFLRNVSKSLVPLSL